MPNAERRTPSSHRIHLRGPWQAIWCITSGEAIGEPVRLKHPDDWPSFVAGRSGRVQLQRTFHAPTNLGPHEAVFILLTGIRGHGDVRLNNHPLGQFHASQNVCEFAVPLPLPFSNSLVIDVQFPAATQDHPDVGLFGPVALEIRAIRESPKR